MSNYVEILNPRAGESPYTSAKRAQRLIDQRQATLVNGKLHLRTAAEIARLQTEMKQQASAELFDRTVNDQRGGRFAGEWIPTPSNDIPDKLYGGPEFRTLQFAGTIRN